MILLSVNVNIEITFTDVKEDRRHTHRLATNFWTWLGRPHARDQAPHAGCWSRTAPARPSLTFCA